VFAQDRDGRAGRGQATTKGFFPGINFEASTESATYSRLSYRSTEPLALPSASAESIERSRWAPLDRSRFYAFPQLCLRHHPNYLRIEMHEILGDCAISFDLRDVWDILLTASIIVEVISFRKKGRRKCVTRLRATEAKDYVRINMQKEIGCSYLCRNEMCSLGQRCLKGQLCFFHGALCYPESHVANQTRRLYQQDSNPILCSKG